MDKVREIPRVANRRENQNQLKEIIDEMMTEAVERKNRRAQNQHLNQKGEAYYKEQDFIWKGIEN